jgi:hypothetical protein
MTPGRYCNAELQPPLRRRRTTTHGLLRPSVCLRLPTSLPFSVESAGRLSPISVILRRPFAINGIGCQMPGSIIDISIQSCPAAGPCREGPPRHLAVPMNRLSGCLRCRRGALGQSGQWVVCLRNGGCIQRYNRAGVVMMRRGDGSLRLRCPDGSRYSAGNIRTAMEY